MHTTHIVGRKTMVAFQYENENTNLPSNANLSRIVCELAKQAANILQAEGSCF